MTWHNTVKAVYGLGITLSIWQQAFTAEITTSLVINKNPHGTIFNSDLGLAGQIEHNNVHVFIANMDYATMSSYTDSTPALYWTKKGFTSTSIQGAYLLWLQALYQQLFCYHCRTLHIAGTAKVMVDDCSQL